MKRARKAEGMEARALGRLRLNEDLSDDLSPIRATDAMGEHVATDHAPYWSAMPPVTALAGRVRDMPFTWMIRRLGRGKNPVVAMPT